MQVQDLPSPFIVCKRRRGGFEVFEWVECDIGATLVKHVSVRVAYKDQLKQVDGHIPV